jgi:hypothetical protein
MNCTNAKAKMSPAQLVARGLKQTNPEHMPEQVATDLLCDPTRRMTRRERRMLQEARQREFICTTPRKTATEKLTAKLSFAPLFRLGVWRKRADKRRAGLQRKYSAAIMETPDPVIARVIAALDLRAAQLDIFMDAAGDEVTRRAEMAKGRIGEASFLFSPVFRRAFAWQYANTKQPHWCAVPGYVTLSQTTAA